MRKAVLGALVGAALAAGAMVVPADAYACGGCFGPPPPPSEQPSIVTDHRMVFSVSQGQTTLYDQIKYTGNPASFAWVLPIVGEVKVGLSSDVMFGVLDRNTQTTIQAPPLNCPARPSDCNGRNAFGAASAADGSSSGGGTGVDVLKSEVVGPYETVQLRSTDPNALINWLNDNKFVIQEDSKPVIAQYVKEHFDFLALKLAPGQNVKSMRPVSITTQGASPVLPLRMVAAGTGATVGITLWVVAEGRYETQNFPSFRVETDEIAWDWASQKSNYTDLRKAKTDASGGRAWELESSIAVGKDNLAQQIQYGGGGVGGSSSGGIQPEDFGGYAPIKDGQGQVTKTAREVYDEDMKTLLGSISGGSVRVTRIRADLSHAALTEDLVISASKDQAVLTPFRQLTKEIGEPLCPVWDGCTQVGTAPRSEAIAKGRQSEDTASFTCKTARSGAGSSFPSMLGLGALASFLALVVVRARKKS